MKLADFTNEIIAISKANGNADMGVATEMFLNNIKDAGATDDQYHYAGADQVDYAALKPHLKELTEDKLNFLEAY